MRRVLLATASTIAGLVLLLSFKTHSVAIAAAPPAAVSTATAGATPVETPAGPAADGSPTTSISTRAPRSTSASRSTTTTSYAGTTVDTQYGPVQVTITVTNGKVTVASATKYPNGNSLDQQINAVAVPILNQEALTAGTANIAMVSGATYTSTGYLASLQSALDKARL